MVALDGKLGKLMRCKKSKQITCSHTTIWPRRHCDKAVCISDYRS